MLKAKHHPVIYPFFKWYAKWMVMRHFGKVRIEGSFEEHGKPVLVVSNHATWWDGFWVMYFNNRVLHRKFHFMMLEEQLKRYWFFQYAGGFSVKRGSRSVLESLAYAADVLSDPGNMVLMFPQGAISTIHTRQFHFLKGVERVLASAEDAEVVFLANLVDWFSDRKPGIYMVHETYSYGGGGVTEVESAYNGFYHRAAMQQQGRAF